MADAECENELSGDEIVDDVGRFDLININRIDGNELERQWLKLVKLTIVSNTSSV
jgi:hypothetical protein